MSINFAGYAWLQHRLCTHLPFSCEWSSRKGGYPCRWKRLVSSLHSMPVLWCIVENARNPGYSNSLRKLSSRQQLTVSIAVSEGNYTCGSALLSPDHLLTSTVSVRLAPSCGDLAEVAFYSQEFASQDECAHCGGVEGHGSPELSAKCKAVLPCCDSCLWCGKKHITAQCPPIWPCLWTGVRLPRI